MLKGITVQELIDRVVIDARSKQDFIVPARAVKVLDGGLMDWDGRTAPMPMTKVAEDQLNTYLGIPSRFVDRLRTDAPDLISVNMNRLLQTKTDDRRMVRVLNGSARAWLSDRYRCLDYIDMAEHLLPIIKNAGYQILTANITETKMYITVVSPDIAGEIKVGSPVRFGWTISDSEVGKGSLNIQLFMEVLRCTNGMTIQEFSKRKAHLGGRADSDTESLVTLSNETIEASDKALWLGVRDHMREFSTPDGLLRVITKLKAQAEAWVLGDPTAVIETLGNKFLLNEDEKKSVLYSFLEEGDRTRWGLSNAITQVANDHADYDRGMELQKLGGDLLMSSAYEFKTIATATA